ncbi:MAG: Elongation factor Ts [Fimbriimonadaceae bacterium]|nr:Elongation factor Ts [Fimbriimonadaceae bacterium]
MAYTAADVKRLRDETGAPMMDCKEALEEANGDYARAKEVLREKGKAAASKKAGRATSAGVVAFSLSPDSKSIGAVVVESETDFVSTNEEFVRMSQEIADYVRDHGTTASNPMEDEKLKSMAEEIVGKFRENVQITKAVQVKSDFPIAFYIHHNRKSGTAIVSEGDTAGTESIRQVAIHATAFPPEVVAKDQLSKELLEKEYSVQYARAIEEGKPENIAKNIAEGRVNKEYIKQVVLLEQPFYLDQNKSVSQYLTEDAKGAKISSFIYLAVGQGA